MTSKKTAPDAINPAAQLKAADKAKANSKGGDLITGRTQDGQRAGNKPKQKHVGKTKSDLRRRGRKIAAAIIAGKSETEALKDAGYSPSYALTRKKEILNNPQIKQTFTAILDAAGLTDEHIAARIKELSGAKETKFFQKDGIVTDQREVEALGIQADVVQFAARLKGHLIDKSEVKVTSLEDALKSLDSKGKVDK